MADDHSVVLVAPNSGKAHADALLAAIFGDAPGATELNYPLSASGETPATHWACHIWVNNAVATVLMALPTNGGTLPATGINWTYYDLTETTAALAASGLTRVSAKTGAVEPASHLEDVKAELGLSVAVPSGPP